MKFVCLVLSLAFFVTCEGNFWARRKVNCGVSVWSDWSSPGADGRRTRTRTIVRPARNGGRACPTLTETEDVSQSSDPWDSHNIPTKFHNKFLTGHTHYYSFVRGPSGSDGLRGHAVGGGAGGGSSGGLTLLPRDLLFIIDMSGSISDGDWSTTKTKLADLVERLCGSIGRGSQHNRIAIITFSSRVVLNFNFKTHWSVSSVRRAIESMPQAGGTTCTGDAFQYAHSYMFDPSTGIRSATQSIKEVLVLTDGHSNCGADLARSVQRLQIKAFVFALAIGDYGPRGKAEIQSMVSRPLIDHIFSLANFIEFKRMVDVILTYPAKCVPFELT